MFLISHHALHNVDPAGPEVCISLTSLRPARRLGFLLQPSRSAIISPTELLLLPCRRHQNQNNCVSRVRAARASVGPAGRFGGLGGEWLIFSPQETAPYLLMGILIKRKPNWISEGDLRGTARHVEIAALPHVWSSGLKELCFGILGE